MTQEFLTSRTSLKQIFLLIDGSIPPQKIDVEMIESFMEEGLPFSLVFTKIDKASQKVRHKITEDFARRLQKISEDFSVPAPLLFFVSNVSGKGRDELLNYIESLV